MSEDGKENSRLQIVNATGLGADSKILIGGRAVVDCYGCDVHVEPSGLVKVELRCYAMNVPVKEIPDEDLPLGRSDEAVNIDLAQAYVEMQIKSMWPDEVTRPNFRIVIEPELSEESKARLDEEVSRAEDERFAQKLFEAKGDWIDQLEWLIDRGMPVKDAISRVRSARAEDGYAVDVSDTPLKLDLSALEAKSERESEDASHE